MGLFTSQYKEDALKWRQQEHENEQKEISRKFKLTVQIGLKYRHSLYKTFESVGRLRDIGFLERDWIVQTGHERLERLYHDIKEEAGKVGIESDSGLFIPHSNIAYIKNAGIVEVKE